MRSRPHVTSMLSQCAASGLPSMLGQYIERICMRSPITQGRGELELKRVAETERRTLRFRNIVAELENLHKLEVVHLEVGEGGDCVCWCACVHARSARTPNPWLWWWVGPGHCCDWLTPASIPPSRSDRGAGSRPRQTWQ
jgi:hypothetical protein